MELADIDSLRHMVLGAAFAVAVVFGFVAQKTHFCTMGALSDIVNMGDFTRMRAWALAVGVAMIGFHTLVWLGWLDAGASIYASGRMLWLSALLGGAVFGFGMVLASGCGSKTLMRLGSGSLKALVVVVVMGLSAFATLRGLLAVLRVQTVDQVSFDVPAGGALVAWASGLLGLDLAQAGLSLALVLGGALVVWAMAKRDFRTASNVLGAGVVGLTVVAMWWVSGRLGFVPEHPETLEPLYLATSSGRMESLSFTAPMAHALDWFIFFSDASKVLTLGVVAAAGVVVGAFVQALLARSFRWEGFQSTQDTALHVVGAFLMGAGGVVAMGCTVGHGLSGLSALSLNSVIAVAGIVLGARAGFAAQMWLIERQ